MWLGVQLLRHQLRHGVVAGGARDAERGAARQDPEPRRPSASVAGTLARW